MRRRGDESRGGARRRRAGGRGGGDGGPGAGLGLGTGLLLVLAVMLLGGGGGWWVMNAITTRGAEEEGGTHALAADAPPPAQQTLLRAGGGAERPLTQRVWQAVQELERHIAGEETETAAMAVAEEQDERGGQVAEQAAEKREVETVVSVAAEKRPAPVKMKVDSANLMDILAPAAADAAAGVGGGEQGPPPLNGAEAPAAPAAGQQMVSGRGELSTVVISGHAVSPCAQDGSLDCRMLITGCGRSGTHFIADQLMKNGIGIKHERIGPKGSVSWIYGAPYVAKWRSEETWFASEEDTRLRESSTFRFFPIIHLVRHPLSAIASLNACFCGCGSLSCGRWADIPSWEFSGRHIDYSNKNCAPGQLRKQGNVCLKHTGNGRLVRSMEYWFYWNQMVEQSSQYRFQMENVDLMEVLRVAQIPVPAIFNQQPFKRKSATRKMAQVSWDDLRNADPGLTVQIQEMTKRYGYTVEEG